MNVRIDGTPVTSWIVGGVLASILLLVTALLVWPFLKPLAWAIIVVLVSWPMHTRIRYRLKLSEGGAAFVTTSLLTIGLLLAVVPLSLELYREVGHVLERDAPHASVAVESLRSIPIVGPSIEVLAREYLTGTGTGTMMPRDHSEPLMKIGAAVAGEVTHSILTLGMAIFASFFFFMHGPLLARQSRFVLLHLGGKRVLRLLETADIAIKGAVYGTLATAFAQGILAGIGFFVAGAPLPVLLGATTTVMSFVPMGAPLVYLPVSLYLATVTGPWYVGVGLGLYCVLIVSTSDNILRAIFISHSTHLSVLLVFVGLVGGIIAFGFIGLFIGPMVMAVIRGIWLDYVNSLSTRSSVVGI